jgi:hypothetical protein
MLKIILLAFFGTWFIIQAAENKLTEDDYFTFYLDMSILVVIFMVILLFAT